MAGRDIRRRHDIFDDHRSGFSDGRFPPPDIRLMEERAAAQSHEIQSLLLDNQRLAATHVALKQDMGVAQQRLRNLSAAASGVKAERDAQVGEVYERSMKLDAELRSIDGFFAELNRVRDDIKEFRAERKELSEKLKDIDVDMERLKPEVQKMRDIKSEIETMRREILRGRAAIEYEIKMHSHNLEVSQAMEKHLVSLTCEAESLRAELVNAEKKRAAAPAAANPGPGYAVVQIIEPIHYSVHQGMLDGNPNYVEGIAPQGPVIPYDIGNQQVHN